MTLLFPFHTPGPRGLLAFPTVFAENEPFYPQRVLRFGEVVVVDHYLKMSETIYIKLIMANLLVNISSTLLLSHSEHEIF